MIDFIDISIPKQELLLSTTTLVKRFSISTALKGAGQHNGSNCTPIGSHIVKEKIGYQANEGTVFVGRVPQPETYEVLRQQRPHDSDWILARILWLSGCEPGVNRLGQVDTKQRYIYIHGTPDTEPMGVPKSHGCIRMRTSDIVELFDHTPLYTHVSIHL